MFLNFCWFFSLSQAFSGILSQSFILILSHTRCSFPTPNPFQFLRFSQKEFPLQRPIFFPQCPTPKEKTHISMISLFLYCTAHVYGSFENHTQTLFDFLINAFPRKPTESFNYAVHLIFYSEFTQKSVAQNAANNIFFLLFIKIQSIYYNVGAWNLHQLFQRLQRVRIMILYSSGQKVFLCLKLFGNSENIIFLLDLETQLWKNICGENLFRSPWIVFYRWMTF